MQVTSGETLPKTQSAKAISIANDVSVPEVAVSFAFCRLRDFKLRRILQGIVFRKDFQ